MFNKKKYDRKWWKDHPEYGKKHSKKWSEDHPEYMKQWLKDNPEYMKKWYKTEKGKANNQRGHIARQMNEKNIINTLTAEEWINILKEYKFKCAYCGKEFTLFDRETRDHIIPLSKGGNNIKENIVPACRSCNSKKNNKLVYELKEAI